MIIAADFASCWRWRTRGSRAMAAQAIFAFLLSFHLGKNQTHWAWGDFLGRILRRSKLLLTAVELRDPQPQQMDGKKKQNKKFAVWFLMWPSI